jgi:hypothetical protein
MSEKKSSRRKFLQVLGLTATATLISTSGYSIGFDRTEIQKLTSKQQEFMDRYEKWMLAFIEVVRIQKTEPNNVDNHKAMISLTEKAETFKPELDEYMQDGVFALIFRMSIEKLTKEI